MPLFDALLLDPALFHVSLANRADSHEVAAVRSMLSTAAW